MAQPAEMEWLARTSDVQVRVMTLAPGECTPWHLHRTITDFIFGLDEGIEVRLRDPDDTVALRPGHRQDVTPGRVHTVANVSGAPARYLLVQGTGAYDFIEVK